MRIFHRLAITAALMTALLSASPSVAQRPDPPVPVALSSFEDALCDSPSYESEISKRMDAVRAAGALNDRQNEALTDWKIGRIEASGAWKKADRSTFAQKLLANPFMQAALSRKQSLMNQMMQALDAHAALEKRGDKKGACIRLLSGMRPAMAEGAQNAADWVRIQALYDAEAARLGVSLKD
jgi:hypothetical protein